MNLTELLAARPELHLDGAGSATTYALNDRTLRHIHDRTTPGARTIETGEGLSTIILAMRSARHTCVSPNEPVLARIKEFCAVNDISLDNTEFVVSGSEDALPSLDLSGLELSIIDGGHSWPTPMIDWYYTARALVPGGAIVLDDLQIWPCGQMAEFLLSEPNWELELDARPRTTVFRRLDDTPLVRHWEDQPYLVARHADLVRQGGRAARVGRAAELLASGDLGEFAGKVRKNLPGRR